MKKLPLIVLLVIGHFLSAQTRFDFLTGMTISSLNEDLMSDFAFDLYRQAYIDFGGSATSDVNNSARLGFYLAAEADFFVGEKSFVKTGLKYTTTGDAFFFKTDDIVLQSSTGTETDERIKLRPRIDYFAIPVNFGIAASNKLSLYGGVTPHFLLSNVIRTNRFEAGKNNSVKEKWDKEDNPVEARTMVAFLNGGASYYFEDGSSILYILDLRFNYGLSSAYNDPALIPSRGLNTAKIWSIELGFGVTLL